MMNCIIDCSETVLVYLSLTYNDNDCLDIH